MKRNRHWLRFMDEVADNRDTPNFPTPDADMAEYITIRFKQSMVGSSAKEDFDLLKEAFEYGYERGVKDASAKNSLR